MLTPDIGTGRSRLRIGDLVSTSLIGLRSRRWRTALTALGIAIGIASMVAVVGISASSKAALLATIDSFGTNLLAVQASNIGVDPDPLPIDAQPMIERIQSVEAASAVADIGVEVRRNRHDTSLVGITALAVEPDVFETLKLDVKRGRRLDEGLRNLPVVVLGDVAATRLGIDDLVGGPVIDIDGAEFAVVGILDEAPLNPDVARSALIGDRIAVRRLGAEPNPSSIFVRVDPLAVDQTSLLLARTANPMAPTRVSVSRPSDLLEARAEIDANLQNLLLALGGVALIVGGVGIANVMVISVLERQGEIGLRRALGATRGHIRSQFVLEAALLSGLGGLGGIGLGSALTTVYANRQGWIIELPPAMLAGGLAAAVIIGVLAGLYPAAKAARLDPAIAVAGGA